MLVVRLYPHAAVRTNQESARRVFCDLAHYAAIFSSWFGGIAAFRSRCMAEPGLAEGDRHHPRCTNNVGIRRPIICLFPVPAF